MFGLPQSPPLGCGLCYRCGKNDGGALAHGKRYFESGDGMQDRADGASSSTVSQMVGISITGGKIRTEGEEEEEEEEGEEAEDIEIFASAPALHPADDLHSLVMSGRTSSNWQGRFDRFKSTGSTGGDSDDTTSISRSELNYILVSIAMYVYAGICTYSHEDLTRHLLQTDICTFLLRSDMSYLSQLDDLDDELNGYDEEEDEEDVEEAAAAAEVREGQRRGRGDSSGKDDGGEKLGGGGDREDMGIEQLPGRNSFSAVSAVSAIEVHLEAMVVEEVPRGGSHGGMGDANGAARPSSPTRLPRKGGGVGVGGGGEGAGAGVPSPSRRRSPPRQNTAAEDDLRRYTKRTLQIPIGI